MALTRITKGVIKPNENYDTHNINSTGIITAVGANFSGNVSVGGTLTYEDVTSIDSVGVMTARDGIHVGAGVSAVGVGTFGGLDISGDIDVDGHTNLDNVSIAGITTTTENIRIQGNNKYLTVGASNQIGVVHTGGEAFIANSTGHLTHRSDVHKWENNAGSSEYLRITSDGKLLVGRTSGTFALDVESASVNSFRISNSGETSHGSNDARIVAGGDYYQNPTIVGREIKFRTFNTSATEGERVRISANGQVRIANTDLTTSGKADNLIVGTTSGHTGITIFSGTGETGNIYFGDTDTSGVENRMGTITYDHSGNYMRFSTSGNNEKVRITSGGQVGIGLTNPEAQYFNNLVVGNNVVGDKGITIRSNSGNSGILAFSDTDAADANRYDGYIRYSHADQHMSFYTAGGNKRFTINEFGFVGVNTTQHSINGMSKYLSVSARNVTNGGSAIEIVGNRTGSDQTLGVINFVNNTSNVAQITAKYQGSTTTGSLQFYTSGTEKVHIDHNGNMQVSTGQFTVGTTATSGLQFINDGTFGTLNNIPLKIRTASTERVHISATNGSVGIGTDELSSNATFYNALTVVGDNTSQASVVKIKRVKSAASNGVYTLQVDSSAHTSNVSSAGAMSVDVNSGRAFTINGLGRIGIGTDNPSRKLDLHESSSSGNFISITNDTTGHGAADGALIGLQDDESLIISNKEDNHIEFHTDNTERLRISSTGNMGLGDLTNVSNNPQALLHIANTSPTIRIQDTTNDFYAHISSDNGGNLILDADAGDGAGSSFMSFKTDGSEKLRITSTGDLSLRTTTQNAYLGLTANSTAINFTLGSTSGTNPRLYLKGVGNGQSDAGDVFIGSGTGGIVQIRSAELIKFEVNSDNSTKEALRIGSDGNSVFYGDVTINNSSGVSLFSLIDANNNALHELGTPGNGDFRITVDKNDVASSQEFQIYMRGNNTADLAFHIDHDKVVQIPQGKLELGSTSGTDNYIYSTNAAGIIYQADNNGHRFQTYSSGWQDRLTIHDNGTTDFHSPAVAWHEGPAILEASNGYAEIFFRSTGSEHGTNTAGTWSVGKLAGTAGFGILKNGMTGGGAVRGDAALSISNAGDITIGKQLLTPKRPAFFVTMNGGDQTTPAANKLPFDTVVHNEGGHYQTTGSNIYNFVCPVAGFYFFGAQVWLKHGSGTGNHARWEIWRDTQLVALAGWHQNGVNLNDHQSSATVTIYCDAGAKVYVEADYALSYWRGSANNPHTFFHGFLIG